ncbi:MAG TPA: hypothetical protein PKI61_03925 [bacterium]|nr:hypothetical protein [bacterium]HPT29775.1 hypothetical protein [bacterium]
MPLLLKRLAATLALSSVLVLPYLVFAEDSTNPLDKLQQVGSGANGPYAAADENSLATIIGTVISVALGLLGIIFIILIVIAGYQWMTAGGNEETIKKSRGRITSAIIGLVITLSAYAIWAFISNSLL